MSPPEGDCRAPGEMLGSWLPMTTLNARREELYGLLGDLPARSRPVGVTVLEVIEHDGYILERLLLDLNGLEAAPAYFAKPSAATEPLPCILYNHAHGGRYDIGKEELVAGRDSMQQPSYAKALTDAGFAVLCFDTWCFGERHKQSESAVFKEMLWKGRVLWGMMVYDSLKALDYLHSRSDVDRSRIGTMGLSMGSTMAWWLAALDERVRVCVDLCCLTDFDALIESQALDRHGLYYYVPSLLKHFTTSEINALIAPRPHLSLAGDLDDLTPSHGLDRVDAELRQVYAESGAPEAWTLKRYPVGHMETAEMRQEVISFLNRRLM